MQVEQEQYIQKVKEINNSKVKKYYILTMGCQLNENDSEKLAGMLSEMNYVETKEMQEADIVIFNTCCVRENAEERLFGKVGEIKKLKESKSVLLAIGGCMMQEKNMVDKIKKSYPFVDIVFGTHTMQNLPEYVYKALVEQEKVKDVIDIDGEIYEGLPIKRNDKFKASVTIMYGCNNFCTYCIVPYVRGRERSREPEEILKEVQELANKIKNRVPNVVLSTDIIVGFPGETEEEFEDTLDVVRKVNYEQIFMFIYSPREGTVAAKRDDQIPEKIKHQRFDRLKDLYDSHVDENNEKYIGTNQKVLIEGYSKNNQEMYTARTDTNKVVVFKPIEGQKIGDIVTVKITSAHKWYLKAEIISR